VGLSRRSIINALATEKSPGSSKVEEKTIFPASICSRMGSGYPIMFNHLSARNLVDIVDKKIRDLSEVFEHCYNKKNKTVKMHCYDKNAFFAILFSEGGLVDARILSAQSGFFLKKQISIMLNYEDIRNQINNDEPTEVEISVLINDDNERTLFQNPDPTQIFYFGNPDTAELINAGLREHSDIVRNEKGIELHSVDIEEAKENGVDPIKKANSLYSDKDIMFVLLDYSVMENDDIKKIFNSIREKDPDMPIYLLYTENKMLHDDEYDNFVCKGVAGKVGIEDIRIRAFIDWLNDTANDSYLQRKAEEFARKSRVLTFETSTPKVEKSKVSIQIMNFSTTTAIHAEDAATMLANHERPTDKFKDIIGISDARETLERCAKFLKNPREYISKDIPQPKGVLLYGPPGTGKTMLARALAAESDAAFFNVNASEFMSKWVGSGPENIRKLFRSARRYTPAVIFIDEIETIGKIRGNNDSDNSASTLTTLLTEMDGFTVNTRRPVLVVAATNYEIEKSEEGLGVLDPALVRRFDETIRVGLPTREDRYEYLTKMLEKCRNYIKTDGNDETVKTIATLSLGLSLADLENVIKYARVIADGNKITAEILNDAYETSKYGKERLKDKESIKRTARHEVGHAIIYYSTGTTPAYLQSFRVVTMEGL